MSFEDDLMRQAEEFAQNRINEMVEEVKSEMIAEIQAIEYQPGQGADGKVVTPSVAIGNEFKKRFMEKVR